MSETVQQRAIRKSIERSDETEQEIREDEAKEILDIIEKMEFIQTEGNLARDLIIKEIEKHCGGDKKFK